MEFITFVLHFVLCFACNSAKNVKWEDYKLEFGKVYKAEDESARYRNWLKNEDEINNHNERHGDVYEQAHTTFSDMNDEEFKTVYLRGLKIPHRAQNDSITRNEYLPDHKPTPDEVNWVTKGYVTEVKDQSRCGSCYAFSATGGLEGQMKKKTGRLISLSEQQIVDCSGRYDNFGCDGGFYTTSWEYIRDVGGEQSEKGYPYTHRKGRCHFDKKKSVASVKGFKDIPEGNEHILKEALARVGPISVAIDAGTPGFRRYRRGVFYDWNCSKTELNHAVLAVGYGTEDKRDFWLVKNSWGSRYGAGGYIKMARNKRNNCGIATMAGYPLV